MNKLVSDREYSSVFSDMIKGVILEKRAVGYKYLAEARAFNRFDDFCQNACHVELNLTRELVESFVKKRHEESDWTRRKRITLLRNLADYMQRNGVLAYVYPKSTDKVEHWSYAPYIFSKEELCKIFYALDQLKVTPTYPNRHLLIPLIFRILYGCGLRISEVLRLRIKDVDVYKGTLTILDAKFQKDRIVPMHSELAMKCLEYSKLVHTTKNPDDYFFSTTGNGKCYNENIYQCFRKVLWSVGISHGGRGKGPRIHDFRHTFAVHCLKRWAQNGEDLFAALPYLSVYLGHSSLDGTQHYLRLTADVYPDIVLAVDKQFGNIIP